MTTTAPTRPQMSRRRQLFAASVGNLVEWYDWYAYSYLAMYFSTQFFPADSSSSLVPLLSTFGVFAVGLAVRAARGTSFNAVHVEHGRATVRAYQEDGEDNDDLRDIVLSLHEFGGPTGNAVELIGKPSAGKSGSASVPTRLLDNVSKRMRANPSASLLSALNASGVRSADARVLSTVLTAERELDGVFTVRAHDHRVGRTHRAPNSLSFFTSADGCYLTQKKESGDGQEWFTVAPADQRKLSASIDGLSKTVTAAPR